MNMNTKERIGELTIGVNIDGYDKTKQQLRNLEATYDRILEKQERVKINKVDEDKQTKKDNMIEVIAQLYKVPLEVIKGIDKAGAYEDIVMGFRAKLRDGTIIKFRD